MRKITTPETIRSFLQLWLRTIPFFPGAEIYDLIAELGKNRELFDDKVRRTSESLRESARFVAELDADLQLRVEKVEQLRNETERLSALASIEEEKAAALIQEIQKTVMHGRGKERVLAVLLNLAVGVAIFVFGVVAGPWLRDMLGIAGS